MKAEELDRLFDEGKEDILQYFDVSKVRQPGLEQKRVNIDFPNWVVDRLDKESRRLGITRQSLMKYWIAERLVGTDPVQNFRF
jgi:hypothetical protein